MKAHILTQTFRLSSRQASLLNDFVGKQKTIEQCLATDQRTLGSLIRQELIDYHPAADAFLVTDKGIQTFEAFLKTDVSREYREQFSPTVDAMLMGSKRSRRKSKNVVQMRKRSTAA